MGLSAVCDCGISIYETLRVFMLGEKCFLLGNFLRTVCCIVSNISQKHVHGLPELPHSDYPFKFLDN